MLAHPFASAHEQQRRDIIDRMALSSTVFVVDIDLSDADRNVYETVSLRLARHPSESDEFLVARLLAYCLEHTEGIEFSRGLCDADEPPVAVRDLTGRLMAWIDVGTPAPERLHRAAKLAPRVVVYVHKDYRQWLADLAKANIHRAGALELHAFDPQLIRDLVSRLDRRVSFALTVADGELFVAFADGTVSGRMTRLEI
jgi:uncharacterized protein YaeQ